jgi:hypothetical protein
MPDLESGQSLATIDDLRIGFACITNGLLHISRMNGRHTEYFTPLLLLSAGYERILKVLLCLDFLKEHGRYPVGLSEFNKSIKGNKGHSIKELLDKAIAAAHNHHLYKTAPARVADIDFLTKNEDFRELVSLIQDFAERPVQLRYYNLNAMCKLFGECEPESPDNRLSRMRNKFWEANYDPSVIAFAPDFSPYFRAVHSYWIGLLQRFTRALCFFFTQGAFGDKARQLSACTLDPYILMRDDELGTVK